jgi:hypothetical protein
MTQCLLSLWLAAGMLLPASASSQQALPQHYVYQQKTIDQKTQEPRSRLTGQFQMISPGRYLLQENGIGDYGKFQDIQWQLSSIMELKEGLLCPLFTLCVVKDKDTGQKIFTCRKDYDHFNQVISVIHRNAKDEVIEEFSFPLEGKTTDFATIVYFLKPLAADLQDKEPLRFQMLSSEPALYKVKARWAGAETVSIGGENVDTFKVRITPDLGLLGTMAGGLFPKTFLWYTQEPPYEWLKYQGLESGKGSARIITTVIPK